MDVPQYARGVVLGTNQKLATFRRTWVVDDAPIDLVSKRGVSRLSPAMVLGIAYVHPYPGTKFPPAFHFKESLKGVAKLLHIHGSIETEGIRRNPHSPALHIVDKIEWDDLEIIAASLSRYGLGCLHGAVSQKDWELASCVVIRVYEAVQGG
jgi:hypothetical protein